MSPERQFDALGHIKDHRLALKIYRGLNGVWIWVGLAAVLNSVSWVLVGPTTNALDRQLQGWVADLWHVGFGIGGILLAIGFFKFWVRWEIAGHCFLTSSILVNSLAIIIQTGGGPSAAILMALGCASAYRVYALLLITPTKHGARRPLLFPRSRV